MKRSWRERLAEAEREAVVARLQVDALVARDLRMREYLERAERSIHPVAYHGRAPGCTCLRCKLLEREWEALDLGRPVEAGSPLERVGRAMQLWKALRGWLEERTRC